VKIKEKLKSEIKSVRMLKITVHYD
jgi:hypothetical protein